MEQINITSAQYNTDVFSGENTSIKANFDGDIIHVPLDPANRHYAEILRQVEDGSLVISPAEGEE